MDQASSLQGTAIGKFSDHFESQTRDITMCTKASISSGPAHSSRASSAASGEWDTKAKEVAQKLEEIHSRRQLLQEQEALLAEEERLEAEKLRSYRTQADSERQRAAMADRLDQIVAEKQEQFRHKMADEVHTRVARSLLKNDEATLDSVKAIANKSGDLKDLTVFKACFFDSISGDDGVFLSHCAVRTLEIFEKGHVVDEKAINSAEASKICFDDEPVACEAPSVDAVVETVAKSVEKVEEAGLPSPIEQGNKRATNDKEVLKEDGRAPTSVNETTSLSELKSLQSPDSSQQSKETAKPEIVVVKEEDDHGKVEQKDKRSKRTSMQQLDNETEASRSRQTSTARLSYFSIGNERSSPATTSVHVKDADEQSSVFSKEGVSSKKRRIEDDDSSDNDDLKQAKHKKKQKSSLKTPGTGIFIHFRLI